MNDQDRLPTSPTGVEVLLNVDSTVRRLIVDYALVAAIIGIAPIYFNKWIDIAGFLALIALNIKLILDIRKRWGFSGWHSSGWRTPSWHSSSWRGTVSVASIIFSFAEAFIVGVFARLAISAVGLFFPVLVAFNSAVGHAIFTWLIGRAANHFYFGLIKSEQVESLAVQKS
ncbi:MAG: hypothetical protein AAGM45_22595 [Cyanobacteria bacterium J06588_5]